MHVIPHSGDRHYYNKHFKHFFILVTSVTKIMLYLAGVPPAPHPKKRKETEGFNWVNQPDAATSQVYFLSFKYSSTCFGHPHAHHQELQLQ
jgi:hypothetical protein